MAMPSPATETDREVLAGIVERVTFHDAEIGQRSGLQFKARFRSGAPGGNADNWPERVAALHQAGPSSSPAPVTATGLLISDQHLRLRENVSHSACYSRRFGSGRAADDPIAGMSYAVMYAASTDRLSGPLVRYPETKHPVEEVIYHIMERFSSLFPQFPKPAKTRIVR